MKSIELEKALMPFERKLRAQKRLRLLLGVREVDSPTYERYILGPVRRFDSRKNAFAVMMDGNPFGQAFRETYRRRTGVDSFSKPLPRKSSTRPIDLPGRSPMPPGGCAENTTPVLSRSHFHKAVSRQWTGPACRPVKVQK
ncbi:MAG: hypothetical protein PHS17_14940 [Desulfobacterales bacterium]|nr:hypothetical protein [Desulfobacterales bacterium]